MAKTEFKVGDAVTWTDLSLSNITDPPNRVKEEWEQYKGLEKDVFTVLHIFEALDRMELTVLGTVRTDGNFFRHAKAIETAKWRKRTAGK